MSTLPDETVRHLRRVLGEPPVAAGRYELGEVLGRGGMGTVHRARDLVLGRDVALKVLRPDLGAASVAARLEREARILARLEHPGIVPVHDAGMLPDGRAFYVMKLVRGERLENAVRDRPLAEALRLFLRICETVGFAHAQGVVHRDLKPSNVMVGAFGEVLVLDWGIARLVGDGPDPESAGGPPADLQEADTAPGTVLGTPGFMAPEQTRGRSDLADARTDVWALGAILRTLAKRVGGAPPRPLASIWTRATAAEPRDRYLSAADLAADVARFIDGDPVMAHRETAAERAGRLFRRHQTAIVLVLTYLVIRFLFLASRGL
jgi:eukaryotic-like serine/threonine-protein kinase